MSKKFYLTTPLYYINGVPHVGHTYTTVIADALARYYRMCGLDVCFLTGTDEHGLNIERAARQQGMTPQQLADTNAGAFEQAWKGLGIRFDRFIRTTEPRHQRAVQDLFRKIDAQGFIYPGQYSGYYCVRCEAYAPEDQQTCPDCGRPTEFMTEESYFFRLSAFQDRLLQFYQQNPDFVLPQTRMNELVSFVKAGLKDLSISRTSFRWGIPIPNHERHIFYVWFDALIGYLSGIGYAGEPEALENHWPADIQLIGKDILRFHAVYWPAFLMAAGLQPPRRLLVHGWWTVEGEKMSKSRGNFITTAELLDLLKPDYVRYFLLRELPIGGDGNFSYPALITRINSDLANDLGNLASRTVKMIQSYFGGKIPEPGPLEAGDQQLQRLAEETVGSYRENFDRLHIHRAIEQAWELISALNKYLVVNEPWALARERSDNERLATVLYQAAEGLRISVLLLSPIIPDGAASILRQLGLEPPSEQKVTALGWGGLPPGTSVGSAEGVYPRIDIKEFLEHVKDYLRLKRLAYSSVSEDRYQRIPEQVEEKRMTPNQEPSGDAGQISIDDFARIEMKVGKILSAERIPRSEKLVKLQVDLGTEVRQVVAGIAAEYPPESLPGRLVVVVTNLKPTRLMGVESNGMIVAASQAGKPVLVTFTEPVEVGARLK